MNEYFVSNLKLLDRVDLNKDLISFNGQQFNKVSFLGRFVRWIKDLFCRNGFTDCKSHFVAQSALTFFKANLQKIDSSTLSHILEKFKKSPNENFKNIFVVFSEHLKLENDGSENLEKIKSFTPINKRLEQSSVDNTDALRHIPVDEESLGEENFDEASDQMSEQMQIPVNADNVDATIVDEECLEIEEADPILNDKSRIHYQNEETLFFEPVENIPQEKLFVSESNHAFNMDELLQFFESKNGITINPYTNDLFTTADLEKIKLMDTTNRLKKIQEIDPVSLLIKDDTQIANQLSWLALIMSMDYQNNSSEENGQIDRIINLYAPKGCDDSFNNGSFPKASRAIGIFMEFFEALPKEKQIALNQIIIEYKEPHGRKVLRSSFKNIVDSLFDTCIHINAVLIYLFACRIDSKLKENGKYIMPETIAFTNRYQDNMISEDFYKQINIEEFIQTLKIRTIETL